MKRFSTLFTLLLVLCAAAVSAQDSQLALDYLQAKFPDLGLEAEDVLDLTVTDDYTSGSVRHIYVAQGYQGVPIFNAQAILHYRGTSLIHSSNRFQANLAAEELSTAPALSAQSAVGKAVETLAATFGTATPIGTDGDAQLFRLTSVSPKPIRARLVFLPTAKDGIRLAWDVTVDQQGTHSDYWSFMVDAADGNILAQHNHVLKCNFASRPHTHNYATGCAEVATAAAAPAATLVTVEDGSSYNVFPFGTESPIHGPRVKVSEPADEVASPFGWHDTDGIAGPEFTYTRGNNVFAFPDRDNDNSPDPGGFFEGGDSLDFDFYFDLNGDLDTLLPAATVQLFYTTNAIHDWLHYAGFDEASGNFQEENYTGNGAGNDAVSAQVQDAANLTGDAEGINNANFATPPDGSSPRMQMYKWRSSASLLTANFPAEVEGVFTTGTGFGPVIASVPTTAEVAYSEPAEGCTAFTNDLTGKIALITRGTCEFGVKVLNAENAGAIGAIVCNDAPLSDPDRGGTINMAPGAVGAQVTIPNVFVSRENCVALRTVLDAGDSLHVTLQATAALFVDGDFDAGIVAHEFGHGVSNRLVGGPNNTNCLFTDEQMGEGWSDFFTLASTPQTLVPNPNGTEGRGIGTYADGSGLNGAGIRRKRYSTDFAVNNFTYDNIITSGVPHPLGEIWATTLWDLYWAMSDEYGFDEDLIQGTGGNNLAVQLVVEGLKFTDCGPGLIDGRNGILAADLAINNGANQCLIWDVFARRGMGFSATAGSPNDRTDGFEAFDRSPYCIGGVQAVKEASAATVEAGENVTFTIRVTNYDSMMANNVVIVDVIPEGLSIDEATISGSPFNISGNTITFTPGDLEFDDNQTIRYTASTDIELGSTTSFFDGSEDGDDNWELLSLTGDFLWEQADTTPFEGDFSWYIVNTALENDQVLQTVEALPVVGDQPGLRFFTKYETEAGWDAGIVEVSTNGTTWSKIDDKIIRGRYRGEVDENGNANLVGAGSFWGNSEGFQEIIIDLAEFAGQDIFFRFRFLSDAEARGRGWWVDNIELLDMVNYNGELTVTADDFPTFTTSIADFGVLAVGGDMGDNTNDPILGQTEVSVFPNPAADFVNVKITSERAGNATVRILSVDGRSVYNQSLTLLPGGVTTNISTAALPAGVYLVQVTGASQVSTTKLTIN